MSRLPVFCLTVSLLAQSAPQSSTKNEKPAPEPDLPVVKTSVTVVSGSRVIELQDESPMKVEAITREAMLNTGYERVADVLAEIPGIVTRRGSTATVGGEQIQGIDSRQVLVLQDGLPVVGARGIKSGAINLNRQSTGRLQQVEVAKGAGSPLYGTDAIGGVVNMITRDPGAPLEGRVSLSGGSLGAFDGQYSFGSLYKKLSFFVNLENHRTESFSLLPGPATVGPEQRRYDGLGKIRYQFTPKFALGFTANAYHNRDLGTNFTETGLAQGLSEDSTQSYAAVADFIPGSSTTIQARAYSARYDENSRTTLLAAPQPVAFANLNERLNRLDSTLSHQFGSRNLLQGGVEWAQNNYRGANRLVGDNAGQQVTSNDYWLQDRVVLGRFTATIGGRITRHSLFGTTAVPRIGLVYKISEHWIARASFGQGFRAPDLGQLYFRFANPASFYQVIGNPNLRPESSTSYSTGVQFRARRVRAGVSLFRNDVRNLIDTYNAGFPRTATQLQQLLTQYGIPANFTPLLNRSTFFYLNFGRIYTQGFELDGEYAITSRWRARGSYTFLDAKDKTTNLGLAQRHRHMGFTGLDYVNSKHGLIANFRGTYFSNWLLVPAAGTRGLGYRLFDVYSSKSVTRYAQFFAAIDNLAGSRDAKLALPQPTFDRPDYGRTFRAGIRLTFGRND